MDQAARKRTRGGTGGSNRGPASRTTTRLGKVFFTEASGTDEMVKILTEAPGTDETGKISSPSPARAGASRGGGLWVSA